MRPTAAIACNVRKIKRSWASFVAVQATYFSWSHKRMGGQPAGAPAGFLRDGDQYLGLRFFSTLRAAMNCPLRIQM